MVKVLDFQLPAAPTAVGSSLDRGEKLACEKNYPAGLPKVGDSTRYTKWSASTKLNINWMPLNDLKCVDGTIILLFFKSSSKFNLQYSTDHFR